MTDGERQRIPWPWERQDDGSFTMDDLSGYFDQSTDPTRLANEWLDLMVDVAQQQGITQPVRKEGNTLHFHSEFQQFLTTMPAEQHMQAVTMAKINAGQAKVGMVGQNGISIITTSEVEQEPDIDALRASLEEGPTTES